MTTAPSLLALPPEIIGQICDQLCRSRRFHALPSVSGLEAAHVAASSRQVGGGHRMAALSRTCRSVRVVCCARMFEFIELPSYQHDLPPCTILHYVRVLCIPDSHLRASDDAYLKMFSNMPNLSGVVWAAAYTIVLSDRSMNLLSAAPMLSSLTVFNFQLALHQPLRAAHLRVLDLSQPRRNIFTVTAAEVYAERTALESILKSLRSQLEVLRVPGESCRSSFLAHAPWPQLSEFVIRGGPPLGDAASGAVLRAMPRLRVLAAAFERFPPLPVVLLLPSALPFPSLDLTRLTIGDGHPHDALFSRLSDNLTEFSLRDVPRYYWRRQWPGRQGPPLLGCRDAMHILRTLPARSLHRLELVVRDDGMQAQLLSLISDICLNLFFLELHLYAADDSAFSRLAPEQVDFPTERIAKAFAPLPHLRVLRLNLDLGLSGPDQQVYHLSPPGTHEYTFHRWWPFLDAQARAVARVLPRLDHVAFLTTQALSGNGWSSWFFLRSPTGEVELKYCDADGPHSIDCPTF